MAQAQRPLPTSVYWRRRIVVFAGLLAIVAVIVLIVVRPGFGTGATPPPPEPTEVEQEIVAQPCLPAQLELKAMTDKLAYTLDESPQIWLEITNISSVECTVSVGTDVQRYVITSGPDQIWASDDCQKIRSSSEILLAPGEQGGTEPIQWERARSSPDTCDSAQRPVAKAGGASYHLRVHLGDLASEKTRQFMLN